MPRGVKCNRVCRERSCPRHGPFPALLGERASHQQSTPDVQLQVYAAAARALNPDVTVKRLAVTWRAPKQDV